MATMANLASRILALIRRRLPGQWEQGYGVRLVLMETFCEIPRPKAPSTRPQAGSALANPGDADETTASTRLFSQREKASGIAQSKRTRTASSTDRQAPEGFRSASPWWVLPPTDWKLKAPTLRIWRLDKDASPPAVYPSRRTLPRAEQRSLPARGLRLYRTRVEPAGSRHKDASSCLASFQGFAWRNQPSFNSRVNCAPPFVSQWDPAPVLSASDDGRVPHPESRLFPTLRQVGCFARSTKEQRQPERKRRRPRQPRTHPAPRRQAPGRGSPTEDSLPRHRRSGPVSIRLSRNRSDASDRTSPAGFP